MGYKDFDHQKLFEIFYEDEEFKKSGFKSNHELVTDSMLNSLCISGSPTPNNADPKRILIILDTLH